MMMLLRVAALAMLLLQLITVVVDALTCYSGTRDICGVSGWCMAGSCPSILLFHCLHWRIIFVHAFLATMYLHTVD